MSILKFTHIATGSALVLASLTTAHAAAVVTDFSGTAGDLGTSHAFGNIIAAAFNSSGETAYLNQRNTSSDKGIGVCNSVDDGRTCFGAGNGAKNEIDNNGASYDWIRLDVSAVHGVVTRIGLSSLDKDTGDDYSIWGNNTGIATFTAADFITHGSSSGKANKNVSIAQGFGHYSYYYVTTRFQDGTKQGANGSDFLLQSITTTPLPVPLPAAGWLLGSGLIGLFGLKRKRSDKAANS